MKRDDGSLMSPRLEDLVARIPQKYELVLAATKRSKQIIREMRNNPGSFTEEQLHTKPLTIALHDIADGKVDNQVLLVPDIEFEEIEPETEFGSEYQRFTRETFGNEGPPGEVPSFDDDDDDDGEDLDFDDSYIDEEDETGV